MYTALDVYHSQKTSDSSLLGERPRWITSYLIQLLFLHAVETKEVPHVRQFSASGAHHGCSSECKENQALIKIKIQ